MELHSVVRRAQPANLWSRSDAGMPLDPHDRARNLRTLSVCPRRLPDQKGSGTRKRQERTNRTSAEADMPAVVSRKLDGRNRNRSRPPRHLVPDAARDPGTTGLLSHPSLM